ncbi:MAG: AAA family ATPase [Methylococcaceae bacterium]|nr:AAA family ATPase [Methylococcaceae bacterium]
MSNKQDSLAPNFAVGLNHDVWEFSDLILKNRFMESLNEGGTRYAIYRELRFAARMDLEALFDDLALNLNCRVQRLDSRAMILDADGIFISAFGGRKKDYSSGVFNIWGDSLETVESMKQKILECVGDAKIDDPMFSVDWHFLTSRGDLESVAIEELADDVLHDEAYPDFEKGVSDFISRYLDADETVLILQGSPGTGKTRFIRAILGEISKRKGEQAFALYTGDKKTLENDEIFVKFITGLEDAFVIEDADHILKPRAEGNENLHRFLTVADGIVRAQGRKIIFSTNLPNVKDLDDALIRPGRCFARVSVRELSLDEAKVLLEELCEKQQDKIAKAIEVLTRQEKKHYSLADIYKIAAQI